MRPLLPLLLALATGPALAQADDDAREAQAEQQVRIERGTMKAHSHRLGELYDTMTDAQRSATRSCMQDLIHSGEALNRTLEETDPPFAVELPQVQAIHRTYDDCLARAQVPMHGATSK